MAAHFAAGHGLRLLCGAALPSNEVGRHPPLVACKHAERPVVALGRRVFEMASGAWRRRDLLERTTQPRLVRGAHSGAHQRRSPRHDDQSANPPRPLRSSPTPMPSRRLARGVVSQAGPIGCDSDGRPVVIDRFGAIDVAKFTKSFDSAAFIRYALRRYWEERRGKGAREAEPVLVARGSPPPAMEAVIRIVAARLVVGRRLAGDAEI